LILTIKKAVVFQRIKNLKRRVDSPVRGESRLDVSGESEASNMYRIGLFSKISKTTVLQNHTLNSVVFCYMAVHVIDIDCYTGALCPVLNHKNFIVTGCLFDLVY
jgi:hypothetical protein